MLSFFPLDVLDEIWNLIESVSEGFLTYSYRNKEARNHFFSVHESSFFTKKAIVAVQIGRVVI